MLRILSSKWTSFSRRDSLPVSNEPENQPEKNEATIDEKSGPSSKVTEARNFSKSDGTIDYDAVYEPSDEPNVSMEGSVVSHLLSQVKIGMDLTRVTLPTFILERRSLLEMYADFFAHPNLFVRIADQDNEKKRMVEVVRWYLCSYHAGRHGSVARKPYNPVLGEIFQCYWDLNENQSSSVSQKAVTDGPVPWCRPDQLAFIAEQVSHHPPISALYAEQYNKKISFNAHVWTKSKFLGLSVGVHNIGQGVIHVIKHNEHYVLTFPSGYGRSILTVPWIELGGSVNISGTETGYKAEIQFLTKPFYGGKRNRISAEVFGPNEKTPFLTITGEWNGLMEAKWSDGRTEEFADVNKLIITRKNVRRVELQEDNESRKLWREVTAGLRTNNVDLASTAKATLEQKQRLDAQERLEKGIKWETKLFSPGPENSWIYNRPLSQRLQSN